MTNRILDDFYELLFGESMRKEFQYKNTYQYIKRYEKNRMKNDDVLEFTSSAVKINKTIWSCWFQGIENAPKLVKKCLESIKHNKPDNFDIVLITEENLSHFIKLPDYINEKYKSGIINKTHFSDIVRAELLSKYGGAWIDATVFCGDKIPYYMLSGDMFLFKWSLMDYSVLSISSWWIYAKKEQKIICEVRNMLYAYWRDESELKNYFLFHIIFSYVIKNDSFNYNVFSNILYCNNSNPHALQEKMGREYIKEQWDILKKVTPVHKLSYKRKIIQGEIYTNYMAFLDGKLK